MTPAKAWVHLHLPRLRAGEPEMLSVKVPGSRIYYLAGITLLDAEFRVSECGRLRTITNGQRNVHAWVVGHPIRPFASIGLDVTPDMRRAVYDPWKGGTFVDSESLEPVLHSSYVAMVGKDVFYRRDDA